MTTIERFRGPVSVVAARKTGPQHLREGTPNQDAFASYHSDRAVIIAVADGLGSASRSDIGSDHAVRIAVQRTLEYLLCSDPGKRDPESLKASILEDWRDAVSPDPQECASTLLVFGCTPRRRVAAQIGDGLMLFLLRGPEAQVQAFAVPQKPYLNVTHSLASENALGRLHAEELDGAIEDEVEAVLLLTDGVSDDLSDPDRYLREVVARARLEGLSASRALDEHLEHWPTPGHYDDKTLLLLDLSGGTAIASKSAGGLDLMGVGSESEFQAEVQGASVGAEAGEKATTEKTEGEIEDPDKGQYAELDGRTKGDEG